MYGIFKDAENKIRDHVDNQNSQAYSQALQGIMKPFNPDEYKGFDSSSLAQSYGQAIKRSAANRKAVSLAGAQKTGALQGGDSTRAIFDISGQEGEQENMMRAGLARQDYGDRYNQWRDQQNMGLQQMSLMQAYQEMLRRQRQGDQQNEQAGQADLGKIAGTVLPFLL